MILSKKQRRTRKASSEKLAGSSAKSESARPTNMVIESLHRGRRPVLRVFAKIGGQRFELVQLDRGNQLEIYDFPRSYRGLPRFAGYLSAMMAEKLLAIVTHMTPHEIEEKEALFMRRP